MARARWFPEEADLAALRPPEEPVD